MTPLAKPDGRERMWQSMRILRQFTVPDLIATASVGQNRAYAYLGLLAADGYVKKLRPHFAGHGAPQPAVWKLMRDTGPAAPRARRGKLFDPNLAERRRDVLRVPRADYERALRCVRACAGMADPEVEVAELKRRAGAAT